MKKITIYAYRSGGLPMERFVFDTPECSESVPTNFFCALMGFNEAVRVLTNIFTQHECMQFEDQIDSANDARNECGREMLRLLGLKSWDEYEVVARYDLEF